jgi:serine/threonine protein kinase
MELLEGETLRVLIASRSLDVATALALAIQVADAVDAAYGKAIIHPDIKPANIFVTATLADLGLSIELTIESRRRESRKPYGFKLQIREQSPLNCLLIGQIGSNLFKKTHISMSSVQAIHDSKAPNNTAANADS